MLEIYGFHDLWTLQDLEVTSHTLVQLHLMKLHAL